MNIELIHFNRAITSDEVLVELDTQGLSAATLPGLLAFGATYPEKQCEFPIVALGSVGRGLRGHRHVAYLHGSSRGRSLSLDWLEFGWSSNYHFAAVRKSV